MYTVKIPARLSGGQDRLVCRLVNRTTKKTVSLAIKSGVPRLITPTELPGDAADVVAWVDGVTDGQASPLTERVRLTALLGIRDLEKLATRPSRPAGHDKDVDRLAGIVNGWRWIQPDQSVRALNRMVQIVGKDLSSESEDVRPFWMDFYERMESGSTLDDGSYISSLVVLLEGMRQLGSIHRSEGTGAIRRLLSADKPVRDGAAAQRMRGVQSWLEGHATLGSALVLAGIVATVIDGRPMAQEYFARARRTDESVLAGIQLLSGIYSYGSEMSSAAPSPLPGITAEWLGGGAPTSSSTSSPTILYSANPDFLRSYAPRLLFYASLFPEYLHHIHLVGSAEECAITRSDVDAFYAQLLDLRGVRGRRREIQWSRSEVPDGVTDAVSYFASARYLVAEQVMDHNGGAVWVQDVDLFPTGDTAAFLPRIQNADVALFQGSFLGGIVPWMRYMAGNVYIADSLRGRAFLGAVEPYVSGWSGTRVT